MTEHINKHHPKEILMLDEFLALRQEVLRETKAKEPVMPSDVAPPGSEDDDPPGESTANSTLPTETKIVSKLAMMDKLQHMALQND